MSYVIIVIYINTINLKDHNIIETVCEQFPPRKIFPPVRVWVRVRVSFRVGGQFSSGAIVLEPLETCRLKLIVIFFQTISSLFLLFFKSFEKIF